MAFMDKLKKVGGEALKGFICVASTSYGTVKEGKHKSCKVGMNSDFDTLQFVNGTKLEASHVIKDDVKTFRLICEDSDGCKIEIVYNDGETSEIFSPVEDNLGNGLSNVDDRLAAHYQHMGDLIKALYTNIPEMTEETKQWASKILRYAKLA